jgi:hypothetical protein
MRKRQFPALRRQIVPLLICEAGLLMSGCSASGAGAGCVAYNSSAFTVDPVHDTSETVAGFSDLDVRMEAACSAE